MDGFFKKVNQKINLGLRPTPDVRPLARPQAQRPPNARPDIAILKDGSLRKKKTTTKKKKTHQKSVCCYGD